MRVFSFITVACILMHALSIPWAYFHFVQQAARYEGMDSPHVRVSFIIVACILMHDLSTSCAYFHFVQQVARYKATYPSHARIFISCNKLHATRRPIHPMSVFSFRAISCTLWGDLSLSWACFHSCNKLHATGDSVVNIVYLWWKFPAPSLFLR